MSEMAQVPATPELLEAFRKKCLQITQLIIDGSFEGINAQIESDSFLYYFDNLQQLIESRQNSLVGLGLPKEHPFLNPTQEQFEDTNTMYALGIPSKLGFSDIHIHLSNASIEFVEHIERDEDTSTPHPIYGKVGDTIIHTWRLDESPDGQLSSYSCNAKWEKPQENIYSKQHQSTDPRHPEELISRAATCADTILSLCILDNILNLAK